jgi:hypothetical protein
MQCCNKSNSNINNFYALVFGRSDIHYLELHAHCLFMKHVIMKMDLRLFMQYGVLLMAISLILTTLSVPT